MMRPMTKHPEDQAGIVLVDILFAIFVLGIAALHFVDARSNTMRRAHSTARLRIARMLTSQKMEEILLNEVSQEPQELQESGTFEDEGYSDFSFDIEEEEVSISSEEDLKDPEKTEKFVRRLTVTVTYPGQRGTEDTFSLTTILPEEEEEEGG